MPNITPTAASEQTAQSSLSRSSSRGLVSIKALQQYSPSTFLRTSLSSEGKACLDGVEELWDQLQNIETSVMPYLSADLKDSLQRQYPKLFADHLFVQAGSKELTTVFTPSLTDYLFKRLENILAAAAFTQNMPECEIACNIVAPILSLISEEERHGRKLRTCNIETVDVDTEFLEYRNSLGAPVSNTRVDLCWVHTGLNMYINPYNATTLEDNPIFMLVEVKKGLATTEPLIQLARCATWARLKEAAVGFKSHHPLPVITVREYDWEVYLHGYNAVHKRLDLVGPLRLGRSNTAPGIVAILAGLTVLADWAITTHRKWLLDEKTNLAKS